MDNNNFNPIISEYPYGELPLKYTKQGQEQLKKELENKNFVNTFSQNHNSNESLNSYNNNSNYNVNTQSIPSTQFQNNNNQFNINNLLPLLSAFGNNSEQFKNIKDLFPLLNNQQPDINNLLKIFLNLLNNKKSEHHIQSKDIDIDNLKKVE